jgi:hypothetical protein
MTTGLHFLDGTPQAAREVWSSFDPERVPPSELRKLLRLASNDRMATVWREVAHWPDRDIMILAYGAFIYATDNFLDNSHDAGEESTTPCAMLSRLATDLHKAIEANYSIASEDFPADALLEMLSNFAMKQSEFAREARNRTNELHNIFNSASPVRWKKRGTKEGKTDSDQEQERRQRAYAGTLLSTLRPRSCTKIINALVCTVFDQPEAAIDFANIKKSLSRIPKRKI